MKFKILALSLFFGWDLSAQSLQFIDTVKGSRGNKEGEFLTEDTKFAHLSYVSWFIGSSVEVDLFARKFIDRYSGHSWYGLEIDGISTTSSLSSSDRQFIHGFVDESEIDKGINALQYINDSLLPGKPVHRTDFEQNMKESDVKIEAYYDPEHAKDAWEIFLSLDRYSARSTIRVKPKDVPDLITALKMSKVKIRALK